MKKQLLNEQFVRMRKLAGLITESKRTSYGIDVWTDDELGVEDLFEEMKFRLQKLQEETTSKEWKRALNKCEMDLEKWADNLGKYTSTLGTVDIDDVPTIKFEEQREYHPGGTDTIGWGSGVYIDILTSLTPNQASKLETKINNEVVNDAKMELQPNGKYKLFLPFDGYYANTVSLLKKLGIKYD